MLKKIDLMKLLRPTLTAIEYAFAILVIAVSIGVVYGKSEKTYIMIAISLFLSIFTSIIWLPSGVEKGEKTQRVYNTTLRYNTYANYIVKAQLFDSLREFVKIRNEQFEQELLTHKLGEYLLKLDNLNKYIELKQIALKTAIIKPNGKVKQFTDDNFLEYEKGFTRKQQRVLEYYSEHRIHFQRLTADDILKGHKTHERLKPLNKERNRIGTRYISKAVWGVVLGLFTASLVFSTKGGWSVNETIQVISWGFSLLMNIYTSINCGFKSVYEDRYNYYKEKNERCVEFFKFTNLSVDEIEKDIKLI